ncbi:hypothetical protein COO72_12240 [Bifidobacterium callitrichos]|nr:hypothetical protein COO72_12240 [Bifidobacterium callitrichos]
MTTDFTSMEPVTFQFEDGHTVDAWWREDGIAASEIPAGWHRYAVMGGKDDDEWEPCAIRFDCHVNHTADIITPIDLAPRIEEGDDAIDEWWFDRDRPTPDPDRTAADRISQAVTTIAAREPGDRLAIPVSARDAIAQAITGREPDHDTAAALELALNMNDREDRPDQWVITTHDLPALARDYTTNLTDITRLTHHR